MNKRTILKNEAFLSGLICFALAFLSLIYFIIKGHGFFALTNDFIDQQIPFTMGLHQAIFDGGISGYSWDIDLGTSTLNGYGFYEIGSPFFWVTMLFPVGAFPYIVGWLFMLKYSAAGVFSYLYLKRFVKNTKWAVLGSVLYAFSGFSIVNMLYYHFHEVVAFFPLMLIGLEVYKERKDRRLFVFSIFLNCVVNYYFFVAEVVFLVIYYLFRFASKNIKMLLEDMIQCLLCGVWGVLMSFVTFLPNIVFVAQNPRTENGYTIINLLTNTLQNYMYILKTLLLPSEAMTSISACYSMYFNSHGSYIPLFGMTLVIAYLVYKKDWLSRLIIFLIVACFIPLFAEGFFVYTSSQMRWWFMMILMFVLASIRMLDEPDKKSTIIGIITNAGLVISLYVALNVLNLHDADFTWISHSKRLLMLVVGTLLGILITYMVVIKAKCNYKLVVVSVSVFAIACTFITVHIYRSNERWMTLDQYEDLFEASLQIELPDNQYRLNDTYNLTAMGAHVAGFSDQSSTDTNSIRDFEDLFDYYNDCAAINKNEIPGLHELCAGKYFLAYDENAGNVIDQYKTDGNTVYLMEGEACPIGFAADSYILEKELRKIPVENRGIALLDSVVLSDEQLTEEITSVLKHKNESDINFEKSALDYVAEKTNEAVSDFDLNGKGITCVSDYDEDTYVYFSVPYDKGWEATIDGTKTQIIPSGGMMLIKVPAGCHDIKLSYVTYLYYPCLAVTWISLIAYVIYCILYRKIHAVEN